MTKRISDQIKKNTYLRGIIYWTLATKTYDYVVSGMKDMTYAVIVDAHVGHYMIALAAVRSYKQYHNLKKIGIIITKKYSDMVSMWKDDIDDVITVDDTKSLFRLNHYLYMRKEMRVGIDERLVPYYYGNGEYGVIKWFLHKNYDFIRSNPDVDINDLANYNLAFSDVNVNSLLRLKMGEKMSIPNIEPDESDIALFEKLNLAKGNGLLLIPGAQCSKTLELSLLKKITAYVQEKGYKVYLNAGPNEKTYDSSVDVLSLSVSQTLKAAKYLGHVVASQSGMVDVLILARFSDIRIITYQGTEFDKRPGYFFEHQNMMLRETGLSPDIYVNIESELNLEEEDIVKRVFNDWI